MTWSGFFRAALNRVISDDSSNSSIVLGLHSGNLRPFDCLSKVIKVTATKDVTYR